MRLREMTISMAGLRRMRDTSLFLDRTSKAEGSRANTVAERGSPVKIPISPTGAMGSMRATCTSSCVRTES